MTSAGNEPSASRRPLVGELLMPGEQADEQSQLARERWLKLLALWTDNAFEIPGLKWRFGLDPIIGLFPFVGDLASAAVSVYILTAAAQMQVPRSTLARMGLNIAIDYVLGSIPLIGNVFDFVWKANHRNVQLLERSLAAPLPQRRRQKIGDWLFVAGVLAVLGAMLIGTLTLAVLLAAWTAKWLSAAV